MPTSLGVLYEVQIMCAYRSITAEPDVNKKTFLEHPFSFHSEGNEKLDQKRNFEFSKNQKLETPNALQYSRKGFNQHTGSRDFISKGSNVFLHPSGNIQNNKPVLSLFGSSQNFQNKATLDNFDLRGTFYDNDSELFTCASTASTAFFESRRFYNSCYEIKGFSVADPGSGEKWFAALPEDNDFTFTTCFKDFFGSKKGILLHHGRPTTFSLKPVTSKEDIFPSSLLNFSFHSFKALVLSKIRSLFQHHILLYSDDDLLWNLSCVEIRLVACTSIYFSFFLNLMYYEYDEFTQYLFSHFEKNSIFVHHPINNSFDYSHLVVTISCIAFMSFSLFCLGNLAGFWNRIVEDDTSYWQGTNVISTFWLMLSQALSKIFFHYAYNIQKSFNSIIEVALSKIIAIGLHHQNYPSIKPKALTYFSSQVPVCLYNLFIV